MQIIKGERQEGKTTFLIKESRDTRVKILCVDANRKKMIINMARSMNISIPEPVTTYEISRCPKYRGPRPKFLIDDLEDVLENLLHIEIIKATTSIDNIPLKDAEHTVPLIRGFKHDYIISEHPGEFDKIASLFKLDSFK